MSTTPNPKTYVTTVLAAAAAGLLLLAPAPAEARFVAEPGLARACADEAMARLNVGRGQLIVLPVEQLHGKLHVNVQTDEDSPAFVECIFDSSGNFLSVHVTGNIHREDAVKDVPKAAIKACRDRLGSHGKVMQISQLRPGFHEIILKQHNSSRQVACTARDDGSRIEDWYEMN